MSLDAQMALLDELPAAHLSPSTPLVPDTNALIADPDLEHWVRAIAPPNQSAAVRATCCRRGRRLKRTMTDGQNGHSRPITSSTARSSASISWLRIAASWARRGHVANKEAAASLPAAALSEACAHEGRTARGCSGHTSGRPCAANFAPEQSLRPLTLLCLDPAPQDPTVARTFRDLMPPTVGTRAPAGTSLNASTAQRFGPTPPEGQFLTRAATATSLRDLTARCVRSLRGCSLCRFYVKKLMGEAVSCVRGGAAEAVARRGG